MSLPDDARPDPDSLLAQVQAQERRATRGKLRIYFGASAGVGKTYAMLNAAHQLQAEGHDVLVGIVETHGRSETAALTSGLTVLPLKSIDYRGKTIAEFDIDAALARHPELILIDELAHSNAPDSRHPKRWQDVEELLDAGIDVFTTVNVQHLESLNDVVGGITGIRVTETLPDTVFDQADEVVLVDIPADELLARLQAGKVYQAQQARQAANNFFRKGNLIALRELALRRTADRIEDDVQAYRVEKSINTVWKTDNDLLACIGPRAGAERIIRSTARLANQLNAQWHAVYVDTPQLQRISANQRERLLNTLKLAQDLGATTAILSGNDIAYALVTYARNHNLSKIILGRDHNRFFWRPSHIKAIATYAPDIDVIETGLPNPDGTPETSQQSSSRQIHDEATVLLGRKVKYGPYLWAVAICVLTTLLIMPLTGRLDLANVVMLFLLAEVLVAILFGRGPAIVATLLCAMMFDFFFLPPRFTFIIANMQYLVTFAVMLIVGLITGQLTAGLRYQANVASHREARTQAVYEFARELSSALQTEQIFEITRNFIRRTFQAKAVLLLPDETEHLQLPNKTSGKQSDELNLTTADIGVAQWAFDHAEQAGMGTNTLPGSNLFFLPLVAPMRTRGVLAIQPSSRQWMLLPEQRLYVNTFATLAAIALERVHYVEVAQNALIRMESERLRNSLLTTLSQDLRAPLSSLEKLSESLVTSQPPLPLTQQQQARALHEETVRISHLVTNLLDITPHPEQPS